MKQAEDALVFGVMAAGWRIYPTVAVDRYWITSPYGYTDYPSFATRRGAAAYVDALMHGEIPYHDLYVPDRGQR